MDIRIGKYTVTFETYRSFFAPFFARGSTLPWQGQHWYAGVGPFRVDVFRALALAMGLLLVGCGSLDSAVRRPPAVCYPLDERGRVDTRYPMSCCWDPNRQGQECSIYSPG